MTIPQAASIDHLMTLIIRYISALAALVVFLLLQSCLRDDSPGNVGNNGTVTIQLQMPELASTRASQIAMPDICNRIHHLDVLVFEDLGGEDDRLIRAVSSRDLTVDPVYPSIRTFPLELDRSKAGQRQRIVVVANLEDEIRELLATLDPDIYYGYPQATITKKDLFDNLFFDRVTDWESEYGGLPMWGESQKSVIVLLTTKGGDFGKISMLYSVAQVDVAVNANPTYTQASGLAHFKMSSVAVYNTGTMGYAVPRAESGYSGGKVTNPSIPDDYAANPLSVGHTLLPTDAGFPILHAPSLHIPEADSKNSLNEDCVFVIVSGYYKTESNPMWYRIDLYDRSSSDAPSASRLDILRGHRYMINITDVTGPGYSSEAEAIASKVSALNAGILAWEINSDNEINFGGGQNYLEVSDNNITIGRDQTSTVRFTVETNVGGGYEVEVTDSDSRGGNPLNWIGLNSDSPAGEPTFSVQRNYTAGSRTAYVHVTAGRISKVVTITQLNSQVLTLATSVEESNDEMIFVNVRDGMNPAVGVEQTLTVTWQPEHIDIVVTNRANVAGGVPLETPLSTTYSGGRANIPVHPDPMSADELFGGAGDLFLEKSSLYEIELVGDDARIRKNVNIRQKSYGVKRTNPDKYYSMISTATGTINMAINTPWVSSISDGANNGVISGMSQTSELGTSGTGNLIQLPFVFSMKQGVAKSLNVSTSQITITSLFGYFPPETITVKGVWGWVFGSDGNGSGATDHSNSELSDGNGIYVAMEYDGNNDGTFAAYESTACQYDPGAVTGTWFIPRIEQLYDLAHAWGDSSAKQTQAHFKADDISEVLLFPSSSTNYGGYWSRSFETYSSRMWGISFKNIWEVDDVKRVNHRRNYRCIRKIAGETYPNTQ